MARAQQSQILNPYEILGVTTGSTMAEIKQKYYQLCKIHHPDKVLGEMNRNMKCSGGDQGGNSKTAASSQSHGKQATEKFKQIKWAYDALTSKTSFKYSDNPVEYRNNIYKYSREYTAYHDNFYHDFGKNYGYQYGPSNSEPETVKKNFIFGMGLIGATVVAEQNLKIHEEAAALLDKAKMASRGVELREIGSSMLRNIYADGSKAKSNYLVFENTELSASANSSTNSNGIRQAEVGGRQYDDSVDGVKVYLRPNKDEQLMRFLITYDGSPAPERVSFPYGKFKEFSIVNGTQIVEVEHE
ncbi:hypothetical protein AX774_g2140 [Zancudomyces culisetae]|uniref:J domain-containing protein n=1 Tax=Zancudomyces culisetae TaxID=1213189 RepID=A0A1R1PTQ1_ZANCU|nr:hypothetical protein AX774_g2140 [Zancudomyces culisetae]|eukprot:OMH84340.1 hypothetical protein AX774_g2140 [Zancudomyces culisetae]